MKTNLFPLASISLIILASPYFAPFLNAQTVIYDDTLGGSGDLYNTAPDTVDGNANAPGTVGVKWITYANGSGAGTLDGDIWTRGTQFSDYEMSPTTYGVGASANHSDAFLPFTPVSGDSYVLTVNLKGNQGGNFDTLIGFTSSDTPNGGGGPNWGFNNHEDGVVNTGDNSETESFLAGGTSTVQTTGFTDGTHGSNPFSDPMMLTIDLTSTGTGTWSVSATGVDTLTSAGLFSTGTYALSTNDISYVGFYSEENVSKLQNFELTQAVPEPSSWPMLVGGLFALLAVRRFRRAENEKVAC